MAIFYQFSNNIMFLFILWIFPMLSISANSNPNWLDRKHHTGNWINHGGDLYNQRFAYGEKKISPTSASNLRLKWEFKAGKDITATPAIFEGILYFPSWNGNIYAVRAENGVIVWQKSMQEILTKISGSFNSSSLPNVTSVVARATPSVVFDRDLLIVGVYGPSLVLGLQRSNGNLVWSTRLDDHPASIITMSGTYYEGAFYVGTSSQEEGADIDECCYFRGSFLKLDIDTGKILWKTFMLPENGGRIGGYSGAAVWGSSPSIDSRRNHVYIATGNLYSVPKRIEDCQKEQNQQNHTDPTQPDPCIEPENHSDSIMALDLDSGEIKWYKQLGGYDVWFFACTNSTNPNCPIGPSPDYDFGEAPMMLTVVKGRKKVDIVAAVQKSGIAWALKRDNGELFWTTEAGPGGIGGGGSWGAATDTKRVYTGIANSGSLNYTLYPSKNVTTGGAWVGMDAQSGKILWTTAVPNNGRSNPVAVANGVLLAGSQNPRGPIYAINAKTGKILWSTEIGATVYGGMSVSNGCFYVGNGYRSSVFNPNFTAGTSLFAYCVC